VKPICVGVIVPKPNIADASDAMRRIVVDARRASRQDLPIRPTSQTPERGANTPQGSGSIFQVFSLPTDVTASFTTSAGFSGSEISQRRLVDLLSLPERRSHICTQSVARLQGRRFSSWREELDRSLRRFSEVRSLSEREEIIDAISEGDAHKRQAVKRRRADIDDTGRRIEPV
jgi:hypothetical protein